MYISKFLITRYIIFKLNQIHNSNLLIIYLMIDSIKIFINCLTINFIYKSKKIFK